MSEPSPSPETLLAAALEIGDTAEQRAYLDRACAGDAALRAEVESLLAANSAAGDFLLRPAAGGTGAAQATVSMLQLTEKAGMRIGRYKLLEQIGEGGFGVVWMAEQEEPVRRRVALKIIKLGMDTKEVVARFEAERQALAMMDHPHIASVFDGGATDTGRPYFVKELVKGIPITAYCDANQLSTRERLDLFMQVCQAVQHAHQKGIIHRDLKPSNILVTVKDDRPVPKVIDFGIAKATQARLTEKTIFTRFQQWIGTPAYMSPEQAGLGSLDVDTRSDIYSLGVLLYELLTGRTPFDTQKLLAAGYDAVMRTIREEEPPKPSTRLSTLGDGELTSVAEKRGSDPAKLNRLVRGDLDWIVMKALEKDRGRRYGTANDFALDLLRYLNDEPVSATAPGGLYVCRKFCRRHRVGLAVALGFTAFLIIATVTSAWLAVRAQRAEHTQEILRQEAEQAHTTEARLRAAAEASEQSARTEATNYRQVVKHLQQLLSEVGGELGLLKTKMTGDRSSENEIFHRMLGQMAERLAKGSQTQPAVELELYGTLAKSYYNYPDHVSGDEMIHRMRTAGAKLGIAGALRLAEVLDYLAPVVHPTMPDMSAIAENRFREALSIRKQILAPNHPVVFASMQRLAKALQAQDKVEAESIRCEIGLLQAGLTNAAWTRSELETAVRNVTARLQSKPVSGLATNTHLLEARAFLEGRLGRWREAAGDLALVAQAEPNLAVPTLVPLLIISGDKNAAVEHQRRLVHRFYWTGDPLTAAETAMSLLLLPDPPYYQTAGYLADGALLGNTNAARVSDFQMIKALAEYRAGISPNTAPGHLESAVGWVEKCLASEATPAQTRVAGQAVLALAQHHLGQTNDARRAVAQAAELELAGGESGDWGQNWPRWLIARILVREAEQALNTVSKSNR